MISLATQHALLQGELADLALYRTLRLRATGSFATVLDGFIATEIRHAAFWCERFQLTIATPTVAGRARNILIVAAVRLFGESAGYLFLEAVETHGIKQYLSLWETVKDSSLREGLRTILTEELEHEDTAATGGNRQVNTDLIRNAFLGFNDGSVEILGAVNGLVAALGSSELVAVTAMTVSAAGAVSMAAGAYLSTHAEREMKRDAQLKNAFLLQPVTESSTVSPSKSAVLVGVCYLVGAAVPVAPFLFGATTGSWSILLSGILILLVSVFLAFLSGMSIARRVGLNAVIICAAVLVSYGIGSWLERVY